MISPQINLCFRRYFHTFPCAISVLTCSDFAAIKLMFSQLFPYSLLFNLSTGYILIISYISYVFAGILAPITETLPPLDTALDFLALESANVTFLCEWDPSFSISLARLQVIRPWSVVPSSLSTNVAEVGPDMAILISFELKNHIFKFVHFN